MQQTRRYPRIKPPKSVLVAWQIGAQRSVSFVESLGVGGLFIRTKNPAPLEGMLQVLVELPTGDVRARAVVRRILPKVGMGVEFLAMGPEDRARLHRLVFSVKPA